MQDPFEEEMKKSMEQRLSEEIAELRATIDSLEDKIGDLKAEVFVLTGRMNSVERRSGVNYLD